MQAGLPEVSSRLSDWSGSPSQVFLPLPSIVVDPTDGEEVESGELRWPPDDVSSDVREVTGEVITGAGIRVYLSSE